MPPPKYTFSWSNYTRPTPELVKRIAIWIKSLLGASAIGAAMESHWKGDTPWWISPLVIFINITIDHAVDFIGYVEQAERKISIKGPEEAMEQITIEQGPIEPPKDN